MKNRNFISVSIILSLTAILSLYSYLPQQFEYSPQVKAADFPSKINDWNSQDIRLREREYENLGTRNLFFREYKNQRGKAVFLYVVYSEGNRRAIVPPDIGYMGSGVTVVQKSVIALATNIDATKMVVEDAKSREIVVFWFRAGNYNTEQYTKQQLMVVLDRMLGRHSAGALIRISTKVTNQDDKAALDLIKSFCEQIEPLLQKYVP